MNKKKMNEEQEKNLTLKELHHVLWPETLH